MSEQIDDGDNPAAVADEVEFIAAERLIFFSDALVAIAITLLALSLRAPQNAASDRDLLTALWSQQNRNEYLAFIISFIVIGAHWRSHHRLFRYVSRLDPRIITLNMIWLLMIVITPFATRLLSGNGGFGVRFAFYALIQILTLLSFFLMARHIRGNALLRPGAPAPNPRDQDVVLLTVAAMFALSIPVAFISAIDQGAFALWLLSAPAARAARLWRDKRQRDSGRPAA